MLCQCCNKKNAVVTMNIMVNKNRIVKQFCLPCSKLFQKGDLFTTQAIILWSLPREETASTAVCPSCGTSVQEYLRTGLVGCTTCYTAFAPWIDQVYRRLGIQHEAPFLQPAVQNEAQSEEEQPKGEADLLREDLALAVLNEDYEKAAVLRDQLRQLSGEGGAQ